MTKSVITKLLIKKASYKGVDILLAMPEIEFRIFFQYNQLRQTTA